MALARRHAMAIPASSCFHYHTELRAVGAGAWTGVADLGESARLLGSGPSVVVSNGLVTLTRCGRVFRSGSQSRASFDGGEALSATLRAGDRLSCWRGGTAEIGLSVRRAGSLVLGLGTLGDVPDHDIAIDHDPRIDEMEFARDIRFIDRPDTRIVWLDPARPGELEARLRELDGDLAGVSGLAIVVRTDDAAVSRELNRRTMEPFRLGPSFTVFLTAAARFSSVDEWLQHGRALSAERPRDPWLRVRIGASECVVPEGTTATVDGWLVHVHRVWERGVPGRLSQLGVAHAEAGVTPAMLERSTAAVARGLT
jgi:hypothetical protein